MLRLNVHRETLDDVKDSRQKLGKLMHSAYDLGLKS